jgi:hypothetical protein
LEPFVERFSAVASVQIGQNNFKAGGAKSFRRVLFHRPKTKNRMKNNDRRHLTILPNWLDKSVSKLSKTQYL